ncbi:prolyl oligopeptidase family serine peptidase [Nonomuraea sp. NPDC050540]|uniref:prolyl oligopeptidase family serine peptidase n=1 Tax=Nonomuraea sp. NPDC050540 TaxID=3364367 RepID=UPI0037A48DA4
MDTLPAQLARTMRFTLGSPRHITVRPDGRSVYFVRSKAGDDPVSCLWALDCATGEERLLVDPADHDAPPPAAELALRRRSRETSSGIVAFAADGAGELLAFALAGELWTVRPATGEVRLLNTPGQVVAPRPDPAGRRIAYVSRGALRVHHDGHDHAVAEPDGEEITFGLPEFVAAEEMGRDRGYWWAPDGRSLLVARVDNTPVQRWYLADPTDPAAPPVTVRYPVVGTANADVTLWLARLDGALVPVAWDTGAFEYLTAAGWDAFGPYAAVQSRDQRRLRILGIDGETGATEVLAEQHDDAWVRLVPGLPARTAAGVLVTSADVEDTRRLLLAGQPVTPAGLQLDEVVAIDGETILFTASDEPTQVHLWAYRRDSGLRRLSEEPGVHTGTSSGSTTVVISQTLTHHGAKIMVCPADGPPVEIASRAERPVLKPDPRLLKLGPRGLRAALFLPSWHRPGDEPLPVLMDPYGGPAMRKVMAARTWWTYVSQWFAEQGFAVLAVDGRGTPGRGPAWEMELRHDLAGPVLADQVEALREAAGQVAGLDLTRVGVRGWSFGGFLAATAVLRRPDVFHAAVAGAPVTDQRMYDTHFRERHLGHPAEHPEAYDRCSPILEAASLTRPLLLIHGLADDNVVAAHSLRLSAALLEAGRPHEVLPLPRASHLVVRENVLRHELDFLRRALNLPTDTGFRPGPGQDRCGSRGPSGPPAVAG